MTNIRLGRQPPGEMLVVDEANQAARAAKPGRREFTPEELAVAHRTIDGLHEFPSGKRLRALEHAVATLARSSCDIAPSRFARLGVDGYFTIDADWIVPALRRAVPIEGPILEPCAGRGHLVVELRRLGFEVDAADLYAHDDPLIPDIVTDADVFDLDSLKGYRWVVTNLPYEAQDAILEHLLPVAVRDGCHIATLARAEWASAAERRALVHEHPHYAGEVRLTKRPIWIRPVTQSPRHSFSWFVWSPEPRAPGQDAFLRFAGAGSLLDGGFIRSSPAASGIQPERETPCP